MTAKLCDIIQSTDVRIKWLCFSCLSWQNDRMLCFILRDNHIWVI